MTWLKDCTGTDKPVIAMAHLLPLPGAPLYDADGGIQAIVDHIAKDIEALQDGGVDAVMFGNEGDRPYLLEASPESLAAMAAVIAAVKGDPARSLRRQLFVGSGGDRGACRRQPVPSLRGRSSPGSTIPTWVCGNPLPRRRSACATTSAATT